MAFGLHVSGRASCFSLNGGAGRIMGHSAGGLAPVCAVSVLVSLAVHLRMQKFLVACLVSAIISSLLIQLIEVLVPGYLNPSSAIALANSSRLALGISVVVGRILAVVRRRGSELNHT